jgi:hypothetical protein
MKIDMIGNWIDRSIHTEVGNQFSNSTIRRLIYQFFALTQLLLCFPGKLDRLSPYESENSDDYPISYEFSRRGQRDLSPGQIDGTSSLIEGLLKSSLYVKYFGGISNGCTKLISDFDPDPEKDPTKQIEP